MGFIKNNLAFSPIYTRKEPPTPPPPPKEYIITSETNPELWNVAVELGWSSDGIGVTQEDAENVTSVHTSHSEPFSFIEFEYFKNVTGFGFEGSGLTSIKIPEGVEELQQGAFQNCVSLTRVELPSSTTIIGDSTFLGCYNLETINLENITDIDNSSFSDCTSLITVDLSSLTWIYELAFKSAAIDELILPPYSQVEFAGRINLHFEYASISKVYVHCEDRANYEYQLMSAFVYEWVDDCPEPGPEETEYTNNWSVYDNPLVNRGRNIWTDGTNLYYSDGPAQYVYNKSENKWEHKDWIGLSSFIGSDIWTDGESIYYSLGDKQYVMNRFGDWEPAPSDWASYGDGLYGRFIWTDLNGNIYYSEDSTQLKYDRVTRTWSPKTWEGLSSFSGTYIWADLNGNIYYSNPMEDGQKVLNVDSSVWSPFSGWLNGDGLFGNAMWTNGTKMYYDYYGSKVYENSSNSWVNNEWSWDTGYNEVNPIDVWSPTSNPSLRLNTTTFRLLGNYGLPDANKDEIYYLNDYWTFVLNKQVKE